VDEGADRGRTRWRITDALRRWGTDSVRLTQHFAGAHALQPVDLQALVAIMSAEGAGEPLTPGRLRTHLGLSSGGTSYVIDRLERAGHVRRVRDDADSRVVQLHYTEQGMATGQQYFGPLGQRMHAVMDGFSAEELEVVSRFMLAAADALNEHLRVGGTPKLER
jgi:DNA-binding MarR family transcriptional regulator